MTFDEQVAEYEKYIARIHAAQVAVNDAHKAMDDFKRAIAPVQVGNIVRVQQSSQDWTAKVARVRVNTMDPVTPARAWRRPQIDVVVKLKSGAWSTYERRVWGDWEVVSNEDVPS